jgi:hypothetical protein
MKNLRQDRLNEYSKKSGPRGTSRDQRDLDYWSKRASANRNHGERATGTTTNNGSPHKDGDLPSLHSTGKKTELRDSSMKPLARHSIDARMVAKQDKNHAGSSPYMRDVRRTTA